MSYTDSIPWICEACSMLGKTCEKTHSPKMVVNDGELSSVESKLVGGFNPCEKYK